MIPEPLKEAVNENPDPRAFQPPRDSHGMNSGGIERFAQALSRSQGKPAKPEPYQIIDARSGQPMPAFANTAIGDLANLGVSDYGMVKE